MSDNNTLDSFIAKKKADSPFISLKDGESIEVKLRAIKMITKAGFGGEEKECIRLECDVETDSGLKIKNFDNSTQRFAQEMADKGIKVGSQFTITRNGEGTKTRYTITMPNTTASIPTALGGAPKAE